MQVQHDLAVTAVYVIRQRSASAGNIWLGEDAYRFLVCSEYRMKVPDALIVDRQYRTQRVIELGGIYSPMRLRKFHRHWSSANTPYEIW
jgi:hypothetical protein